MEPRSRLVQALIRPVALASCAVVALALTGCATGPALVKAPAPGTPAPESSPPPAAPEPKASSRPTQSRPTQMTGTASWYGKAHHGQPTASGEIYDMHALTAAHPSLPLGTRVRVVNVKNDRTVEVRINDRGPFVRGRILDLSYAAAQELGGVTDGAFRVKILVLSQPPVATARASTPTATPPSTPTKMASRARQESLSAP
jgi:rare lipoprotein A